MHVPSITSVRSRTLPTRGGVTCAKATPAVSQTAAAVTTRTLVICIPPRISGSREHNRPPLPSHLRFRVRHAVHLQTGRVEQRDQPALVRQRHIYGQRDDDRATGLDDAGQTELRL